MALSWRQQQKEKLREHLYAVSLRLFREQGYDSTTVDRITREAGVGKGTFFNHFPAKEHVLSEWYTRISVQALEVVEERAFGTAREAIAALARALVGGALADPLLWDMKSKTWSDTLIERERELDERLRAFCIGRIEQGKAQGELDKDLDSGFFAATLVAVFTGTGHEWTVTRHAFDLQEILATRIDFLFKAAARP